MTRAGRVFRPFIAAADALAWLLARMLLPGAASSRPGSPVLKSTATLDLDLEDVMNVPLSTLSPSWLPDPTGLVVRWTAFRHSLTYRQRCPCWICGDTSRPSRP
jgi:hypothetical protein